MTARPGFLIERSAPLLTVLVFRPSTGCRQYPFATIQDLEDWTARMPQRGEQLRVQLWADRLKVAEGVLPGALAVAFAREMLIEQAA
ncbi:MAG: hypothetical protein Q7T21_02820 [Gallionella sp.]|nr:hypothetical protein [Gallionella sp.]